jgi:hypothetical protein
MGFSPQIGGFRLAVSAGFSNTNHSEMSAKQGFRAGMTSWRKLQ